MVKKIVLTSLCCIFCLVVIAFTENKAFSNSAEELDFATNYFKILYEYDIQATKFAQDTRPASTSTDLIAFYRNQYNYLDSIIKKLEELKSVEKYNQSYNTVLKGFKLQQQYLNSLITELNNGSTFEKAFAVNNWSFYAAQKNIQDGMEELKNILNTYTVPMQFKILSGIQLNEDQLRQNAENSEIVKQLQQGM